MRQHKNGEILWYQFEQFAPFDGRITHGIFARQGGVSHAPYATLNAGLSVGDAPALVAENRRRIVATLPGHPPLVTAHPVHGTNVVEILPEDITDPAALSLRIATKADAMITQARGVGLFWAYADCTPLMIFDPVHDAIALVHAGWRGTSGAVAIRALEAMNDRYG